MPVSVIEVNEVRVPAGQELEFVAQVMRQSEAAVLAGLALPIDQAALTRLMQRLRPEVEKQLRAPDVLTQQQKWWDDSRNVLMAANMLGVIATAVARLNHQPAVDGDALAKAFELVKAECGGRFGPQGCYCGC